MVVIKNFDMPKDCDSCRPMCRHHYDAEDGFCTKVCSATGENLRDVKSGERHEKCPLVDIDTLI